MRLDIFHPGFGTFGGAEVLLLAQARGLRQYGFEPRMASFDLDEGVWSDQLDGLPTLAIPKRALSDLFYGMGRMGKVHARFRRVRAALSDSPLVLAHNFPANAMAGRLTNPARTVWYSHEPPRSLYPEAGSPMLQSLLESGVVPEELKAAVDGHRDRVARKEPELAAWEREGVAKLSAIVANSGFTASVLKGIYGRCDVVIPPMVPCPKGPRAKRGSSRGLQILTQSRLDHMKNVGTVIRGFAAHLASHPEALLHVVGEGRDRSKHEALARALGIEARVRFHGHLPQAELDALRAEVHVFALVPVDEPFGMVFAEAALAGLLVVGPNQGGPMEILEGGDLGAVADPRSPEAVAEALNRLASLSDEAAEALRDRAHAACQARYAPDVLLPQLAAVLRG
jgi:glycosyltransferase involved in cell wall biosynthesis